MTKFAPFHFDPAYRCEADAAPVDGLPNYLFGRDGRRIEDFELEVFDATAVAPEQIVGQAVDRRGIGLASIRRIEMERRELGHG